MSLKKGEETVPRRVTAHFIAKLEGLTQRQGVSVRKGGCLVFILSSHEDP